MVGYRIVAVMLVVAAVSANVVTPAFAATATHPDRAATTFLERRTTRGTISAIQGSTVVVVTPQGETTAYQVTRRTQIAVFNQPGPHRLSDLAVGQRVSVVAREQTPTTAYRIVVAPASAAQNPSAPPRRGSRAQP